VLLRGAAKTTAIAVAVAVLFCFFVLGESEALGALLAGGLGGGDFLALIYLVGKVLDPQTSEKAKTQLLILLASKLAIVAGLFWAMVSLLPVGGLGLVIGLAAAIGGFTLGLHQAQGSEAGKRAVEEEEERLRQEKGAEDSDFE
jgi:hypothetical protein